MSRRESETREWTDDDVPYPQWRQAVLVHFARVTNAELFSLYGDYDLRTPYENGFTVEDTVSDAIYDLHIPGMDGSLAYVD